jgi:uncharacterized membrane protein
MIERFRRNVLAGFLAIIPVLVTIWIVSIVLNFLIRVGRPVVSALARSIRPETPLLADLLLAPWFQSLLAVLVTLVMLAVLGALTKAVLGRRLLAIVDAVMARIPFVETIYGAARTLIKSFQGTPAGGQQRVVLIEFPSPEMKAVGLVTRIFRAADTGEELAAVYVPTTPNPTSGYLEVAPVDRLVWLDWTANEAMQFVISGGTLAPEEIRYRAGRPSSHVRPGEPELTDRG